MNFHSRFRDMAIAADDLVGIAPAETMQNGLLAACQHWLGNIESRANNREVAGVSIEFEVRHAHCQGSGSVPDRGFLPEKELLEVSPTSKEEMCEESGSLEETPHGLAPAWEGPSAPNFALVAAPSVTAGDNFPAS